MAANHFEKLKDIEYGYCNAALFIWGSNAQYPEMAEAVKPNASIGQLPWATRFGPPSTI